MLWTFDALVVQGDLNAMQNFPQKVCYFIFVLRVQVTDFILQQNQVYQLCFEH